MDARAPWDIIRIELGDITRSDCEAIVNAANSTLLGGGGVDGAIHRAAGPELLEACRKIGGCPCGEARITPGFRLPARFIIHTVGPVFREGKCGEPEKLRSCYARSLDLAVMHGIRSIAFPAISCGVYRYPIKEAARIALSTCMEKAAATPDFDRISLVLFDRNSLLAYQDALTSLRP